MARAAPDMASPACSRERDAATKLQALFRARRCRSLHVARVRRGLPWSPFVPAKMEAVDAMLRLAQLQEGETLLDVGSGDGRVLIAAAQTTPRLARVVGVEIDPTLVAQSTREIQAKGLGDRVSVLLSDWLDVDMHDVDVVILFFLPHDELAGQLQARLRPGTRVVTYVFDIPQWVSEHVEASVPFMTCKGSSPIYRYRVPVGQAAKVTRDQRGAAFSA